MKNMYYIKIGDDNWVKSYRIFIPSLFPHMYRKINYCPMCGRPLSEEEEK